MGPVTGRVVDFAAEKTEILKHIKPGPSIRYKAMGSLLSVVRPGPYTRGDTVLIYEIKKGCSPFHF